MSNYVYVVYYFQINGILRITYILYEKCNTSSGIFLLVYYQKTYCIFRRLTLLHTLVYTNTEVHYVHYNTYNKKKLHY